MALLHNTCPIFYTCDIIKDVFNALDLTMQYLLIFATNIHDICRLVGPYMDIYTFKTQL